MKLTIEIDADGAAFELDPWPVVSEILSNVAEDAREGRVSFPAFYRDPNGNVCAIVDRKRG